MTLSQISKVKNENKRSTRLSWRGVALAAILLILTINAFLLFKLVSDQTSSGSLSGRLLYTSGLITYSLNLETGERTHLLEEADQYTRGVISPDGASLATIRATGVEGEMGVSEIIVSTTSWGGGWHSLGKYFAIWEVSWTSDSQWLLYSGLPEGVKPGDPNSQKDLWLINVKTSERQQITNTPYTEGGGVVSPDGTQIAYIAFIDNVSHLMTLDTTTRQSRQLLPGQQANEPVWSPDSQWIAFTSEITPGGNRNIWIVRSDGTDARAMTDATNVFRSGSYTNPLWLP